MRVFSIIPCLGSAVAFARADGTSDHLGSFRRGFDEGHRRGVDEGYAQGRTDFLSKVLLSCAACRQPVLVDLGEKGGVKTGPRRLLERVAPAVPPSHRKLRGAGQ